MFTGIITHLGIVENWDGSTLNIQLQNQQNLDSLVLTIGMSVAINGACLTLVDHTEAVLIFEVIPETVEKTNLQYIQIGDEVNMEFAMLANGRFEGHIVQGHVDCCAQLQAVSDEGNSKKLIFGLVGDFSRYMVSKGSICINGISLTLIDVSDNTFSVGIIPHTWEYTNLKNLVVGSYVNIEVDVVGKYVEKFMSFRDN